MNIKKMKELVNTLNIYSHEYYVLDNPSVSDMTFDALYDELQTLERKTGVILDDSPSRKVGGEILSGFTQHTHLKRLYSLNKCKEFNELKDWANKIRRDSNEDMVYVLEYKLDGLSLCLTYDKGKFISATTRGDGVVGEDVTAQVMTIKSLPLSIDYQGLVEVYGEGIMKISSFEKYNKTADEPLKNPRNGVAGAIRTLDPKITATRNLDIIFYGINYIQDKNLSQQQTFDFLKQNKFLTVQYFVSKNIDQIIDNIKTIQRDKLDFPIDGMVIKVDDIVNRNLLGYTDKFPRWAIAYKFEAEEADSTLLGVEWNVGRTGKLTPLAHLKPVEFGGVTVRRATLNNIGDIQRKKLKVGGDVLVRRSNDVIPEVMGSLNQEGEEIIIPEKCPACSTKTVTIGAHLFCPNENGCPPQIYGRLEHFASKGCMDITGISTKTVQSLYEELNITSPTQLYTLTSEDLRELDGFKDRKISNILVEIEKSKNVELGRFINALGIPNVGKKLAGDLAKTYRSMDKLMNASAQELAALPDIGEITAIDIRGCV